MIVDHIESVGFKDRGAVIFQVDSIPERPEEWQEAIGELPFDELFGGTLEDKPDLVPHPGENVPYKMVRTEDGTEARDWWASDHILHVDGTPWDVQPVFTVIGCKEAQAGAPETRLVDTVRLLEVVKEKMAKDRIWKPFAGMMDNLESVFAYSTYHAEALPHLRSQATHAERRKIDGILRKDFEESHSRNLHEHIEKTDKKQPPKAFPLVRLTWLDEKPSLFIDGGVRNSRIQAPDGRGGTDGVDYTDFLHAIRSNCLTGDQPLKLGLVKDIGWAANKCVIFPQIGTLHQAKAGNNVNRWLTLAFLTDARLIAEQAAKEAQ